jgi:hypothetical protein
MGRSLHFTYRNIMKFEGSISSEIKTIINNLKIGDRFHMKLLDYQIPSLDGDSFSFPLIRTPSTYGYDPLPLCCDNSHEYIVENINDEPGLMLEKGIRSISFTVFSDDTKYFKTHRLVTDGTIRECEGLGIDFVVEKIDII